MLFFLGGGAILFFFKPKQNKNKTNRVCDTTLIIDDCDRLEFLEVFANQISWSFNHDVIQLG